MVVRRFTLADSNAFFQVNGDPEVMRYIRPSKNRAESDDFLRENIDLYQTNSILGRYAVFHKTANRFLGTFSFLYLAGDNDFHLGYALIPGEWGKGFATELVENGVAHFFRQTAYDAVFAITEIHNTGSRKVLEKTGFLLTGQLARQEDLLHVYKYSRSQQAIHS